jgi:hypothetical protein
VGPEGIIRKNDGWGGGEAQGVADPLIHKVSLLKINWRFLDCFESNYGRISVFPDNSKVNMTVLSIFLWYKLAPFWKNISVFVWSRPAWFFDLIINKNVKNMYTMSASPWIEQNKIFAEFFAAYRKIVFFGHTHWRLARTNQAFPGQAKAGAHFSYKSQSLWRRKTSSIQPWIAFSAPSSVPQLLLVSKNMTYSTNIIVLGTGDKKEFRYGQNVFWEVCWLNTMPLMKFLIKDSI